MKGKIIMLLLCLGLLFVVIGCAEKKPNDNLGGSESDALGGVDATIMGDSDINVGEMTPVGETSTDAEVDATIISESEDVSAGEMV
ncbi:MAG: hypothetical protein NTZ73_00380 [Candidatus Diapherotrites archaeon]|nr:hypothetical protein [Candidatus Diapherotrites archaeon]